VTRHDLSDRGAVMLVCSDGLTKHVSDSELSDRLTKMVSSQQLCEELLELALARGGSDNITIVAGRAPKASPKAV
jgi:protein phosphatase